jgi:hypothetical protein
MRNLLIAIWCRIVHATYDATPIHHSWNCTCRVCGRRWVEHD